MVLSRIWSAFIIIAIAVASIKYFSSENYSQIFNDMVVGKGGDTIQISQKPLAEMPTEIQKSLLTNPDFEESHIHYKMDSLQNVIPTELQKLMVLSEPAKRLSISV